MRPCKLKTQLIWQDVDGRVKDGVHFTEWKESIQKQIFSYISSLLHLFLNWENLSLIWQLDRETIWKAYIESELGTYKNAFQVIQ